MASEDIAALGEEMRVGFALIRAELAGVRAELRDELIRYSGHSEGVA
jgi:hypothetical protein